MHYNIHRRNTNQQWFSCTNPAEGIFDTINYHCSSNTLMWIEYKRSKGGVISEQQLKWYHMLQDCGQQAYVINSLKLLKEKYHGRSPISK